MASGISRFSPLLRVRGCKASSQLLRKIVDPCVKHPTFSGAAQISLSSQSRSSNGSSEQPPQEFTALMSGRHNYG